jgi:hypothetical protein
MEKNLKYVDEYCKTPELILTLLRHVKQRGIMLGVEGLR